MGMESTTERAVALSDDGLRAVSLCEQAAAKNATTVATSRVAARRRVDLTVTVDSAEVLLIDRNGAALHAIHAFGIRDEVGPLDKDLSVLADGDGAVADSEGELFGGFEEEGVG